MLQDCNTFRPRFAAACLLLLSLLLAGCVTAPTANHTLNEIGNLSALRAEALSFVNQQRRAQGFAALRSSAGLNATAQAHAEDMARRSFYSHYSPEGQDAQARYRAQGGPDWHIIGENIASCRNCASPSEQLQRFQRSWMNSRGHRKNILNARYEEFGFGIAAANGRLYAVQMFVSHRRSAGAIR